MTGGAMDKINNEVKKLLEENKDKPHPKDNAELQKILEGIEEFGAPKEGTTIHGDWSVKGRVSDF